MMFFLENVAYSQLNKQHLVGRCGSARKMICVKAGRGGEGVPVTTTGRVCLE